MRIGRDARWSRLLPTKDLSPPIDVRAKTHLRWPRHRRTRMRPSTGRGGMPHTSWSAWSVALPLSLPKSLSSHVHFATAQNHDQTSLGAWWGRSYLLRRATNGIRVGSGWSSSDSLPLSSAHRRHFVRAPEERPGKNGATSSDREEGLWESSGATASCGRRDSNLSEVVTPQSLTMVMGRRPTQIWPHTWQWAGRNCPWW